MGCDDCTGGCCTQQATFEIVGDEAVLSLYAKYGPPPDDAA